MNIDDIKVDIIYKNEVGASFRMKYTEPSSSFHDRINIVFNNTVLHLNKVELHTFTDDIKQSLENYKHCGYEDSKDCKSIFLETPFPQVNYCMSYEDLLLIDDLVSTTNFYLSLDHMMKDLL